LRRLVLRLVINAVALYAAAYFVPGISADGGVGTFLLVGIILGLANALVRPVLNILSCPLMVLTLGLFGLVINAIILWLTSAVGISLGLGFYVTNFGAAFLGGLVVAIVNWTLSLILGEHR